MGMAGGCEGAAAVLEKLREIKEEVLTMAGELLMSISQDEREWAIFRSRRKFQTDMQSNLATEREEGRAEGRAEGEQNRNISFIKNLTRMGFSLEQITEATGLSLEEVKRLRTEN